MKIYLLLHLLFVAAITQAQTLVPYSIDRVTVSIPKEHEVTDTLGQQVVYAEITNGVVLVSKYLESGTLSGNVENEVELDKFYEGVKDGAIKTLNGVLESYEYVSLNNLKAVRFTLRIQNEEDAELKEMFVILLNENLYVIQLWYSESDKGEISSDREKIFSSITVDPDFIMEDQFFYIAKNDPAYNVGFLVGKVGFYVLLILVLGVVFFRKKKRNGLPKT